MSIAESRGSASGGAWGNAPTGGRVTIPKEKSSPTPVSYTHLDVYKRQALERVRLNAAASVGERAFANTKLTKMVIPTAGSFPLSAVQGTRADLRLPADATDEQLAAWNETLQRPWYDLSLIHIWYWQTRCRRFRSRPRPA